MIDGQPSEYPGLVQVCGPYLNVLRERLLTLEQESRAKKRQGRQKREELTNNDYGVSRNGRPPRPTSHERIHARRMAIRGVPYVLALDMVRLVMKIDNSKSAKRLSDAFRLEYRLHNVEPPPAPKGWWSLQPHGARWPDWEDGDPRNTGRPEDARWMKDWRPEVKCPRCNQVIDHQDKETVLLLIDGPFGVGHYPTHKDCLQTVSKF